MTELCAIACSDAGVVLRSPESRLKFYRECSHGNVSLRIQGDQPVDPFVFESADVSLICRADLLGSKNNASVSPAAYIASRYQRDGDDFARSLRGTFAVILYDHRSGALKVWTDHFGVQGVVYAESPQFFAAATDIHGLLGLFASPPAIDPAAILEYFQYACIPTPRTIYKGFSKLEPGRLLIWERRPSIRTYWDMKYPVSRTSRRPGSAWAAATFDEVRSAVSLNLTGLDDGSRAGCFLSGGADSSSIAGLVGQLTGRPPQTFSIGFDDPRYNELHYARLAAKRFGAASHEYFVTPRDILDLAERAAAVYEEPFGNASVVPTYFCARLAVQNGVTHLLAGDGGDELFGGNTRYAVDRLFSNYARIPSSIRRWLIEPIASYAARRERLRLFHYAASYVRRSNIPAPDRYFSYSLISSTPMEDLFSGDFMRDLAGHDPLAPARNHFFAAKAEEDLNRWLYLDLKIVITDNDLRKVTRMCRLAGAAPRYPLLDPTLAEFTGAIPPDLKVRGRQLRYVFKKAMRDVLPREIIKKKKHGFGLPYGVWVGENKSLRDFTFDVLGSRRCRQRGYFRRDLLESLWKKYELVHRAYYGEALWMFLMFELWHVVKFDRIVAGSPEIVPIASSSR